MSFDFSSRYVQAGLVCFLYLLNCNQASSAQASGGTTKTAGMSEIRNVDDLRDQGYSVRSVTPIFGQLVAMSFPRGFKPAYESTAGNQYLQESVMEGETVDRWSQMITVSGMRGIAATSNFTPLTFVAQIATGFKHACSATYSTKALGTFRVSGYEAFAAVVGCGTAPDENPHSEATLIVAIKGASDYYTIQWAERGAASSKPLDLGDQRWMQRITRLQPLELCSIVPGEEPPYPSCVNH